MTRTLFVCIGNSCRSPMAEGFARAHGEALVESSSAGVFPARIIQPETFQVMAERGIELDPDQAPRSILMVPASQIDVLINMSGQPLGRLMQGFTGREIIWDVPDPIGKSTQVYRAVRDRIEKNVQELLEELRTASVKP